MEEIASLKSLCDQLRSELSHAIRARDDALVQPNISIHVYIFIERERESKKEKGKERERKKERKKERRIALKNPCV